MGEHVDAADVITRIEEAFSRNAHPGDPFLLGSFDGDEPLREVSAFHGMSDWHTPTPEFLDVHYTVLSFFSEGGFRFFLPAYLIADVKDLLKTADPVFHLTHGFYDITISHEVGEKTVTRSSGRTRLINPRRYGAITFLDYARYRLAVFAREECAAIVNYLELVRERETRLSDRTGIDRALEDFWRPRAEAAPAQADLARHLKNEAEYVEALLRRHERPQ